LKKLEGKKGFTFVKGDILDRDVVAKCMKGVDRVIHLAALAGVRYSFEHPEEYISINTSNCSLLPQRQNKDKLESFKTLSRF
jgi:nucleoside-diphosphate-sugar epimerase